MGCDGIPRRAVLCNFEFGSSESVGFGSKAQQLRAKESDILLPLSPRSLSALDSTFETKN